MITTNENQENNKKILTKKTVGYATLWAALLLASPILTDKAFAGLVQVNKSISPLSIDQGDTATLSISIFNSSNQVLTNVGLPDNMPTQMKILPAGVTSNTCGGTVTAVPGTSTITLSGGTVPAISGFTPGSCTINVAVTANSPGNYINTIATGALTNTQGQTTDAPSSATLQTLALTTATVANAWSPTTIFGGPFTVNSVFQNPPQTNPDATNVTIDAGQVAKIRFDITNISTTSRSNVSFSDALPGNVTTASVVNPVFGPGCGGTPATTTAANSGTVNFSGVTIAAGSTCTLTVDVTSLVPNAGYNNGINQNSVTHAPSGTNSCKKYRQI
jgi:uncharacterized repeat protein (TIGR01451 family)